MKTRSAIPDLPGTIVLCAATPTAGVALCAALPLPVGDAAEAPAWVHLLPAGELTTVDMRGPYRVTDPAAIISASLHGDMRLPLDENHATDLAAPRGEPAPARGWIVALQSRQDGIWGQVEWTDAGRQLVADKAYRHISPVISHSADNTVTHVLRASLVNRPNLRGLATLHQQDDHMDFMARLRKALGLSDNADETAIVTAADDLKSSISTHAVLAPIAQAAGLAGDADGTAVLQAVQALADPAKTVPASAVVALQSEITGLKTDRAREKAELFVDASIKAGKISAPAQMRDHYIARHMAEPAAVEKEIGVMVVLNGRGAATSQAPTLGGDGKPALPDDPRVIALMGVDPEAFRKAREAEASREEAL